MVIAWSGGCDSTALIIKIISDRLKYKTGNNERIVVLSLHHHAVCAQDENKKARFVLREFLRKIDKHQKIDFVELNVTDDAKNNDILPWNYRLIQPIMWISNAITYLEQNEDLYVGWIKGDCSLFCVEDIKIFFNAMQRLQGKTGKLRIPFYLNQKHEIVRYLRKVDVGGKFVDFVKLCWWCESPKGENNKSKQCGWCVPCTNFHHAELILKHSKHYHEFKRKKNDVIKLINTPVIDLGFEMRD